ncbi:hypothetical protein PIB30_001012 [Stylosanthes scabra]|uniref:Uncharacterized protein n=1 Tax=Stylosanthes scabra TaxID=79078 RepID=A0ABU6T4C2_9FABA|nr:hypothetical protein [Stylosanthes scabra]
MNVSGNPPGTTRERQASPEEQDQLNRSKKKVRKEGESFSGELNMSMVPRKEEWMNEDNPPVKETEPQKTFAQMVKEGNRSNMEEDDDFSEEDEMENGEEESEDGDESDNIDEESTFPKGITVEKT